MSYSQYELHPFSLEGHRRGGQEGCLESIIERWFGRNSMRMVNALLASTNALIGGSAVVFSIRPWVPRYDGGDVDIFISGTDGVGVELWTAWLETLGFHS